jgi:hypothetical protein
MIAGIVIAVIVVGGLVAVGIVFYVSKMRVKRRTTAAGIRNVSYDNSKDETDSRPTGQDIVTWGGQSSREDQRNAISIGGSPPSTWNTYDNVEDLTNYDVEIEKRLDSVRVGRLSFQH